MLGTYQHLSARYSSLIVLYRIVSYRLFQCPHNDSSKNIKLCGSKLQPNQYGKWRTKWCTKWQ